MDDFGFTIVDAVESEEAKDKISDVKDQRNDMYAAILPLLDNLMKNPKKDYIHWPGKERVQKIEEFKEKLKLLINDN